MKKLYSHSSSRPRARKPRQQQKSFREDNFHSVNLKLPNISNYQNKLKVFQNLVSFKKFHFKQSIYLLIFLAIILLLVNLLGLSSNAKIVIVGSKNNTIFNRVSVANYQTAYKKFMTKSLWNDNKITFRKNDLINYLLNDFPELARVDLTIPFLSSQPTIYLSPTSPALILIEPNGFFAIDSKGRAIAEASNLSSLGLNTLPEVTDLSGVQVSLGKLSLSSSDVFFIQEVVGQLNVKGYKIAKMTLPSDSAELDVYLVGQSYYIKFNLENNDPRQQAGTFLATIAYLKARGITPTQYIDVRVNGRAYYQ